MKKVIALLSVLVLLCTAAIAADKQDTQVFKALNVDGIYDKYQAVYLPSNNIWTTGSMVSNRIVLTKKTSSGTGSYSEYYDSKGKLAIALGSNYEFIKGGALIAVHNADLKFYTVTYNAKTKKFSESQMTAAAVQKLFPNAQIIKVSEFKNGKYTLKKPEGVEKEILILNDTDNSYYKYSYAPETVIQSDVKGLIWVNQKAKIKFSHYEDKKSPTLTLIVKTTKVK